MREDRTKGDRRVALMAWTIDRAFENGIPVTLPPRGQKAHHEKRWPEKVATDWSTIDAYGDLSDYNVALVVIPELSDNFVDVDLDSEVAKRTQPYSKLPESPMVWGRSGNPASHFGYRTSEPVPHVAVRGANGVTLMEARTGNRYSLAPGSVHDKDDEVYQWESCGPPCEVDAAEFQRAFDEWAAMTTLASGWPDPGGRSEAAGHLAGALAMGGVPVEDAERIMRGVCAGAEDEEVEQRVSYLLRTYEKFERGEAVTGKRSLAVVMDRRVVRKALTLLGVTRAGRPTPSDLLRTGFGNATRFAELYGDRVRYCELDKAWYIFNGKVWQPDDVNQVMEFACQSVLDRAERACQLPRAEQQDELRWATASLSGHRLRELLDIARSFPEIRVHPTEFDDVRDVVACQNGVVSLRTGDLMEFDPSYMQTKVMGGRYLPGVRGVASEHYLSSTFDATPDLIPWLKRVAGHTLTAELVEEILPILCGPGGAGKSTLADALAAGFGDYGVAIRPELFERAVWGARSSEARSDLVQLRGRRFAYAEEKNKAIKLDTALLKSLTGKGRFSARDLYAKEQQIEKTVTPWLLTNHFPQVEGHDEAMWRRIKVVMFTNRFRDDPGEGEKPRDVHLKDAVVGEVDFWTTWLIEGAVDWYANGLQETDSVREATRAERAAQDELSQWFEDEFEVNPTASIPAAEVIRNIDWWWERNGTNARPNRNEVNQWLREKGFERRKSGAWRWFGFKSADDSANGLTLMPLDDEEPIAER